MDRVFALVLGVLLLSGAAARAGDDARPAGSANFDGLIATAKKSMMTDPKAALVLAQQAEAIAQNIHDPAARNTGLATSLWLEAESLTRVNQVAQARPVLNRAIALAEADGKTTKLDGDLALSLARIADATGDIATALKSFHKAHDIFAKLAIARSRSIALQGLGNIYSEAHDFDREIGYYRRASQAYSEDPVLELSAANNIGFALQDLGRYDEAIKDFRHALDIATALKSPQLQANILTNLTAPYAKTHRFAEADAAVAQALRLIGRDEAGRMPFFVWGVKAQIEYERGDIDAAAIGFDRAFRGVDLKTTTSEFKDFHEVAYKVYRAKGNYPLALAHLEAFKRLDDQGNSLAASANLALIGAQFDFTNQQLEIEQLKSAQLQRDISLRESRAATQRVIFMALLLAGLVLILWIGWRHSIVTRHRNAITKANIALTKTLGERDVEIARRTEVEAELRLAKEAAEQANRAKSHFLANMSHELRTPLNAIIGFSELMAHGIVQGPKLVEYASDINTSGQNLLTILNDILDMARIDAGTVTLAENDVFLGEVVEAAIAETQNARGAAGKSITFDRNNAGAMVRGDDKRLRQILVNLLSNAVKFTKDDGHIAVRIEHAADGIDIAVIDDGVGIPDDKLAMVMEPFGQAESAYARLHGGVGLGLPIIKALVQMHGGRFTLESEVDRGTTARVHLPMERVLQGRLQEKGRETAKAS
jgi:signal transduction histidine kinase